MPQAPGPRPVLLTRDTETYNIPDRLPVVPLRDVVVFPYVLMPLLIGRPASLSAVEAAAATPERWLVLVTQRNADVAEPAAQAIIKAAKTGKIGDGKVFVVPITEAIRIRTDETGEKAL